MQEYIPRKTPAEDRDYYSQFAYRGRGRDGYASDYSASGLRNAGARTQSSGHGGYGGYGGRDGRGGRIGRSSGGRGKGRPRMGRAKRAAVGFMIAVFLFCALLTADHFAGGRVLGWTNIDNISGKVGIGERTYYAVEVFRSVSDTLSREAAAAVREEGGAGFIFNDGEFHVLAAAYAAEKDALSAKGNFAGDYAAEVFPLKVSGVTLKYRGKRKHRQAVEAALSYPHTAYTRIFALSRDLDAGVTNPAAARLELDSVRSELAALAAGYAAATDGLGESFGFISEGLNAAQDVVFSITDGGAAGGFSSALKYAYLKIILDYIYITSNI